jgi:hypothetical protein
MIDIVERLTKWRDDSADLRDEPESAALLMAEAALQISILRVAIRRLAEQDATLSVQGGNVTVTLDATLTDAEREAIREACDEGRWYPKDYHRIHTLRGLLERQRDGDS